MGIQIQTRVEPDMCYVDQPTEFGVGTYVVMLVYSSVIAIALIATLRDDGNAVQLKYRGKLEKMLMAFSIKKTLPELLSVEKGDGDIKCIHGIRALATVALYVAHKVLALAFLPYSNRIKLTQVDGPGSIFILVVVTQLVATRTTELTLGRGTIQVDGPGSIFIAVVVTQLVATRTTELTLGRGTIQLSQEPLSMLLRASFIYTDSFLLLSGVLTAYHMSCEMKRKGGIDWKRRYLARFISAPLTPISCSLDMQLSLVAPLLVYLLFVSQGWGILLLVTLHVISGALRYYVSVQNNLSMLIYHRMTEQGAVTKDYFILSVQTISIFLTNLVQMMSLNQLYDTANMSYSLPTHRATPYMFGVCLGYLLHKTDRKIYIPKFLEAGLSASYLAYLSFFSTSEVASPDYWYEAVETSLYSALSPVTWSLALCWVILACATGYGEYIVLLLQVLTTYNPKKSAIFTGKIYILSTTSYYLLELYTHAFSKDGSICGLATFSKISYSVYLTQFAVFFYNVGTTKTSQEFNAFTSAVNFAEIIFVLLASTIMTLLFDLPMQEVKNLLMETNPTIRQEAIPHPLGASAVHRILPTLVAWASQVIDPVGSLDADEATALRICLDLKAKYADIPIGREKHQTAHLLNLSSGYHTLPMDVRVMYPSHYPGAGARDAGTENKNMVQETSEEKILTSIFVKWILDRNRSRGVTLPIDVRVMVINRINLALAKGWPITIDTTGDA
uniref:Uncharacterized protein n=1 Tax=Timema cristinae TaxID=61476 RepID=A0A7R9CS83_TIMCR|nr:unnamed protein product [Timema cristinae]